MSCDGCSVDDRDAVAVFMCAVCEHSRESGMVSCSLRGKPIVRQVCGGVLKADAAEAFHRPLRVEAGNGSVRTMVVTVPRCERGPDEEGIVRWMGIRWRGVPWVVKVMLADDVMCGWFGAPRAARMEDMPGCGCIDKAKTWCEKVSAWLGWDVRDRWVEAASAP